MPENERGWGLEAAATLIDEFPFDELRKKMRCSEEQLKKIKSVAANLLITMILTDKFETARDSLWRDDQREQVLIVANRFRKSVQLGVFYYKSLEEKFLPLNKVWEEMREVFSGDPREVQRAPWAL